MNQKELKWGETPFDQMTHEELLTHSKRMFSALQSAHNELNSMQQIDLQRHPFNPYWMGNGSGNRAFQKTDQAIKKVMAGYSEEEVYRNYFRYVSGLLFDAWPGSELDNWMICTGCGRLDGVTAMTAIAMSGTKHSELEHYPDPNCNGVLRRMNLNDLKPTD